MKKTTIFKALFSCFTTSRAATGTKGGCDKSPARKLLRLESLEERQLLSVTATEYKEIREAYPQLELPIAETAVNIIEVSTLTAAELNAAITKAAASAKDDLIVARTTYTSNTITFGAAADSMVINVDPATYGKITIVGYGKKALTIDAAQQNRIMQINQGTVQLANVSLQNGSTTGTGSAGAIYLSANASLTATDVEFLNNKGYHGGAIRCDGGSFTLSNVSFKGNSSTYDGGAIYTESASTSSLLSSVEFVGNKAGRHGGAIENYNGTHYISNCAFWANEAGDAGGAFDSDGTTTLVNCTIAGNKANRGGGIYKVGTLHCYNTIIASNRANSDANYRGSFNTNLNNIVGGDVAFTVEPIFDDSGALTNADLIDLTLMPGSMAINTGDDAYAVDSNGVALAYDLAGSLRVIGEAVDVGAYETTFGETAAENFWLDEAENSNWSVAANWSLGHVPTIGEIAVIITGQTVSISTANNSTALLAGRIQCSGELKVERGILTVTRGDSVIDGSLTMASGTTLAVQGKTTTLTTGSVEMDGVNLTVQYGATATLESLVKFNNGAITVANATIVVPNLADIHYSRINLSAGAVVALPKVQKYTAPAGTYTLFSATGEGTRLDLSSLQNINCGWNDDNGNARTSTIRAADFGQIDFSNVLKTTAPNRDEDSLKITEASGGTIDFSSLTETATANTGYTIFTTDSDVYTLPCLTTAVYAVFNPGAETTLNLPELASWNYGSLNLAPKSTANLPKLVKFNNCALTIGDAEATISYPYLTNIDGSRIALSGGAQLKIPNAVTSYVAPTGTYTLFSATGEGTRLDLSSLQDINCGWEESEWNSYVNTINASDMGQIDLSGVLKITAPYVGWNRPDYLQITEASGGTIDLTWLTGIESANSGYTVFTTDKTEYTFPNLRKAAYFQVVFTADEAVVCTLPVITKATMTTFTTTIGSTLTAPKLAVWDGGNLTLPESSLYDLPRLVALNNCNLTIANDSARFSVPLLENIDGSRIALSGGAQLALPGVTNYVAPAGTYTIFSATNKETLLDLSSLQNINCGWNDDNGNARTNTIRASYMGQIDLSSVLKITAPWRGEDYLQITEATLGTIDFASLTEIASASSGYTIFTTDAEERVLENLISVVNTTFVIEEAMSLNLPNLVSWKGGTLKVPAYGTFWLPRLSVFTGTEDIAASGKVYGYKIGPTVVRVESCGTVLVGDSPYLDVYFNMPIQPDSFTPDDVVAKAPDGTNFACLSVETLGDSVFRLFFDSAVTQTGTYRVTVGSDILNLAGNQMNQNGKLPNGEANDAFSGSFKLTFKETLVVNSTLDVVDSTDGVLTLREAVAQAVAGDTIRFDAALAGKTITLAGSPISITKGIALDALEQSSKIFSTKKQKKFKPGRERVDH